MIPDMRTEGVLFALLGILSIGALLVPPLLVLDLGLRR